MDKHTDLLYTFYRNQKRMPSYQEAAKLFGLSSKDSAYRIIEKIRKAGLIAKDHAGKLIPTNNKLNDDTGLKVLGVVEAGFPTPGEENLLDTVTLDDFLIGNREASFMLKVKGESMRDAGIRDGDLVIVERTEEAKTGQIVIAEVDGMWTMKYLRKNGKEMYLEPANPSFKNIYPKEGLSIAAVVKTVIRKYS